MRLIPTRSSNPAILSLSTLCAPTSTTFNASSSPFTSLHPSAFTQSAANRDETPTPAWIQNGQAAVCFSAGRITTYSLTTPGTSKTWIEIWSGGTAFSCLAGEVANFTHSDADSGAVKGMQDCPSALAMDEILAMSCRMTLR